MPPVHRVSEPPALFRAEPVHRSIPRGRRSLIWDRSSAITTVLQRVPLARTHPAVSVQVGESDPGVHAQPCSFGIGSLTSSPEDREGQVDQGKESVLWCRSLTRKSCTCAHNRETWDPARTSRMSLASQHRGRPDLIESSRSMACWARSRIGACHVQLGQLSSWRRRGIVQRPAVLRGSGFNL